MQFAGLSREPHSPLRAAIRQGTIHPARLFLWSKPFFWTLSFPKNYAFASRCTSNKAHLRTAFFGSRANNRESALSVMFEVPRGRVNRRLRRDFIECTTHVD